MVMVSGNNKAQKKSGRKGKPVVRPVFLIAGAIALLGFGIVMGIGLDLAMRQGETPSPANLSRNIGPPHPSPNARPPEIINLYTGGAPREEFLEGVGIPNQQRAWAPDSPNPYASASAPVIAYSIPVNVSESKPVVAIVIDDMGLDRTRSFRMMELNGPLTVSLMTYANGLPELVTYAHQRGHEVMGHLPMEPLSPDEDPGPGALMTNMSEAEIREHLAAYLDPWQGYVGINNHMGSKFTARADAMRVVMDVLRSRGLMWLDSKTSPDRSTAQTALEYRVPFVERDIFLDNEDNTAAVLNQLEKLEEIVKERGFAVGIGHPHDSTIEALRQWMPTLRAKGIELVPVTEILKRRLKDAKKQSG